MKYGWGESGMGVVEVASNAKAISQSTSDGPNRHTKRVGVIFKTEDGTPAGILNNRRSWAEGRVAAEGMRPRKRNRNVVEEYSSERPRREEWQAGKLGNWTWTLLSNANATRDTEASLALPRLDSQCTRTETNLSRNWHHPSPVAWLHDCSLVQLNGILGNSLYFLLFRGTTSAAKLFFLAVWFLEYISIYHLINLYICGLEFAPTCWYFAMIYGSEI